MAVMECFPSQPLRRCAGPVISTLTAFEIPVATYAIDFARHEDVPLGSSLHSQDPLRSAAQPAANFAGANMVARAARGIRDLQERTTHHMIHRIRTRATLVPYSAPFDDGADSTYSVFHG